MSSNGALGDGIDENGNGPNPAVRKRVRAAELSANLTQFGGYEKAPEVLGAWIAASSLTVMTSSTEAGRRTGDYNVRKVETKDVGPLDVGLVAVEELDADEVRDMDFVASSDILFFEFLGKPGAVAYIRCLGCLGDHLEGSELTSKRFTVERPSHFLLAMGDLLDAAINLKTSSSANGRAASGAPREKKPTNRAQDAGGERVEGEKSGNYFIVTRDGMRLPTRDKSNLQIRCDQLEFMWRAADKGLWKHMAGSGFKLQSDIYWRTVLEEAEVLQQPVDSPFHRAGKVYLISGTGIATKPKLLELFLRGDFGEDGLTLDSFSAGSRLTTTAFPCILQNAPLVGALEAIAVALEVLFSSEFAGVCDDLVEALRGHLRPLRLTDSGFLVHTVERVFVKFFRIVSKDDEDREIPNSDITNPTGCASLLKGMLNKMVDELVDVAKVTILEKRYTVLMRLRKERASDKIVVEKAKAAADGRGRSDVKVGVDQCGSHLGELLKAKKKNGSPLKCGKGTGCKYGHGKLSDLSKASAVLLVSTMPVWLQDCLSPLVASCKGFKS